MDTEGFGLTGRCAVVTGGTSGIGLAVVRALVGAGAWVTLCSRHRNVPKSVLRTLRAAGGHVQWVACHVEDEASVRRMVARASANGPRHGRLDIAVNCAGIEGPVARLENVSARDWDRTVAVNLRGAWLCMKHEIRRFLKSDGGAIVNISSIFGMAGAAELGAYCAAKHGVLGLTRTAAIEHAKDNIRVNAVCPGAVDTPMLARLADSCGLSREQLGSLQPIGRLAKPDEIADIVLWLCSERAHFVNGQAIVADSGRLIRC